MAPFDRLQSTGSLAAGLGILSSSATPYLRQRSMNRVDQVTAHPMSLIEWSDHGGLTPTDVHRIGTPRVKAASRRRP